MQARQVPKAGHFDVQPSDRPLTVPEEPSLALNARCTARAQFDAAMNAKQELLEVDTPRLPPPHAPAICQPQNVPSQSHVMNNYREVMKKFWASEDQANFGVMSAHALAKFERDVSSAQNLNC